MFEIWFFFSDIVSECSIECCDSDVASADSFNIGDDYNDEGYQLPSRGRDELSDKVKCPSIPNRAREDSSEKIHLPNRAEETDKDTECDSEKGHTEVEANIDNEGQNDQHNSHHQNSDTVNDHSELTNSDTAQNVVCNGQIEVKENGKFAQTESVKSPDIVKTVTNDINLKLALDTTDQSPPGEPLEGNSLGNKDQNGETPETEHSEIFV